MPNQPSSIFPRNSFVHRHYVEIGQDLLQEAVEILFKISKFILGEAEEKFGFGFALAMDTDRIADIFTILSQLQSEKDGNLTINFNESFMSKVRNSDGPLRCAFQ